MLNIGLTGKYSWGMNVALILNVYICEHIYHM